MRASKNNLTSLQTDFLWWEALRLDTPPPPACGRFLYRGHLLVEGMGLAPSGGGGGTPGQVSALLIGETKPETLMLLAD